MGGSRPWPRVESSSDQPGPDLCASLRALGVQMDCLARPSGQASPCQSSTIYRR